MDTIIFMFIGILCLSLGIRVYISEEPNTIFNKFKIQVTDVKKYNHACGVLIIGFGVAAEITLLLSMIAIWWVRLILTAAIIAEAFAVMKIYKKIETKYMVKR